MKKALDILGEFPDEEIFFLPVRIDECRPENEILQDINWANLFPSYDEGFGDILRTLNAVRQSSPMIEGPHGMKFALIKESPVDDPQGPDTCEGRVFRGGSWDDLAAGCRSAGRPGDSPGVRSFFLGFRLLRSSP